VRLGVELQQQRPQPADGLVERPDRVLVLAGQRFDRRGVVADGGQPAVLVPVGAQQVGQHERVARVGLLTGLPVSFPVTGDRPALPVRQQRRRMGVLAPHVPAVTGRVRPVIYPAPRRRGRGPLPGEVPMIDTVVE
jgi:hypothetical protein